VCKSVADAADRQYAYVVVTTKAIPELTKTSQILSPLLAKDYIGKFEQPNYVLMQNGLNVEVDLHNTLTQLQLQGEIREKPSIITSALWIATNLKAPNVVEHNEFVRVIQQLLEQNIVECK
jgi:2-dehydropantoate 2-reductase